MSASMRESDARETSAQIVPGGCYGQSPWDAPQLRSPLNPQPASRRWVVVAAVALIAIVAFALVRYFTRR